MFVDETKSWYGSGALAIVLLDKDKLLEDEAVAVGSVALVERRREKSVWKEAMDDRRRSEVRREFGSGASLDPLLREGMFACVLVCGVEWEEKKGDECCGESWLSRSCPPFLPHLEGTVKRSAPA